MTKLVCALRHKQHTCTLYRKTKKDGFVHGLTCQSAIALHDCAVDVLMATGIQLNTSRGSSQPRRHIGVWCGTEIRNTDHFNASCGVLADH